MQDESVKVSTDNDIVRTIYTDPSLTETLPSWNNPDIREGG